MSGKPNHPNDLNPSTIYQVRVIGHLSTKWAEWFGSLTITLEENGETVITGESLDQAALHGLLNKIRDLGLTLVSVTPVIDLKRSKK